MKLEANMRDWIEQTKNKIPIGKTDLSWSDVLKAAYGDSIRTYLENSTSSGFVSQLERMVEERDAMREARRRMVEDQRAYQSQARQEQVLGLQSAFNSLSRTLYGDWYGDGTRLPDENVDQRQAIAEANNVGRR